MQLDGWSVTHSARVAQRVVPACRATQAVLPQYQRFASISPVAAPCAPGAPYVGTRVAHPFHVAFAEAGITSGKRTFVPLGPASAWRWSVCVIVAVVAASATLARQHIAAENTPVV